MTNEHELAILARVTDASYAALEEVDILASGYEFDCPECDTYNTLIAIPKHGTAVECHYCHKQFSVGEALDAQS